MSQPMILLVIQANKKQQTDEEKDEGWTHLFEELRSFVLAENTSHLSRDGNNSNSQANFSKHTFFSRSEVGLVWSIYSFYLVPEILR